MVNFGRLARGFEVPLMAWLDLNEESVLYLDF